MTLVFEHPYFAFGALALAALCVLYFWYRRSKRRETSALFLWDRPESTPQSGSRFELRRPPLSFYLEALILTLLCFAAMSPFLLDSESRPPLAVIFDNSFSMRAAEPGTLSPKENGMEYLRKQLAAFPRRRIIFIRAGIRPHLLSDSREVPDLKRSGNSDEPASDLSAAFVLAQSRAANAEILVLTDHAPSFPLPDGCAWFSAGKRLPNTAIVNARRVEDRLLLEIVNHSNSPAETCVVLSPGGRGDALKLAPEERRKIVMRLPDEAKNKLLDILLDTPGDPLPFDNRALLPPEDRSPVSYASARTLSPRFQEDLNGILKKNPDYTPVSAAPELLFCESQETKPEGANRFILHKPFSGKNAILTDEVISPLSGHPLLYGLPLQDLRWAADPSIELPGRILLRRGDAALLSEVRRIDGKIDIHINLFPEKSNLAKRPFQPILFWNLAEILRAQRPGPEHANCRAGETVGIKTLSPEKNILRVTRPDGTEAELTAFRGRAFLQTDSPGIYRLDLGGGVIRELGASGFSSEESELRNASSYLKEARLTPDSAEFSFRGLAAPTLLLAMLLLLIHQYLLGTWRREL